MPQRNLFLFTALLCLTLTSVGAHADGQALRVVGLGPGPGDTLRVTGPGIKAGQKFLIKP